MTLVCFDEYGGFFVISLPDTFVTNSENADKTMGYVLRRFCAVCYTGSAGLQRCAITEMADLLAICVIWDCRVRSARQNGGQNPILKMGFQMQKQHVKQKIIA